MPYIGLATFLLTLAFIFWSVSELTGRELIRLFARLRGIPEKEINHVIDMLATELLLSEHLDKPCGTYR